MSYVRNAWYVAAWSQELVSDRPVGVRILDEPIVVWRNAAGDLTAFEDRCVHRLARLSLGRCEGERLRCMYHGMLYERGGRVIEIPGQDRIPATARLRVYPVRERLGWVWIWMGDPATAIESLIPPVVGLDHPDPEYIYGRGQLDYGAEARLINDNLLDLSHVSFLHSDSFRMSDIWAREHPKVTEHERGVRSERWIKGEGVLGELNAEELVDTYFCYDFYVPGVLMMTVRTYALGTADALNGQPPDLNRAGAQFTTQAITPLTSKSARYFYIMGKRREADQAVYDLSITERAFAEDKKMIEAQQQNIDFSPGRRFMSTAADRAGLLFNRIVQRIVGEESAHAGDSSSAARSQRPEFNNPDYVG